MQPLGQKPLRFPGKVDHHPRIGLINWWEKESRCQRENKKAERRIAKKECDGSLEHNWEPNDDIHTKWDEIGA